MDPDQTTRTTDDKQPETKHSVTSSRDDIQSPTAATNLNSPQNDAEALPEGERQSFDPQRAYEKARDRMAQEKQHPQPSHPPKPAAEASQVAKPGEPSASPQSPRPQEQAAEAPKVAKPADIPPTRRAAAPTSVSPDKARSNRTAGRSSASSSSSSHRGNKGSQTILISAAMPGEIRVAIMEKSRLEQVYVEYENMSEYRDSIFKGKVVDYNQSLNAYFVSIGLEKDGFLPQFDDGIPKSSQSKELARGDEVLVQVVHQNQNGKGAKLRQKLRLPGKYLILMPSNPEDRRSPTHSGPREKERFAKLAAKLNLPDQHGLVMRTRALTVPVSLVQKELAALLATWNELEQRASVCEAPRLLLLDGNLLLRTIRDQLHPRVSKIIIDDERAFASTRQLVEKIAPEYLDRLEHYSNQEPLFRRYQVTTDLEQAHQRKVRLPAGGEIVIDRTEALTAIDVNSRAAYHREGPDALALNTNLEAGTEINRQLRLRDIGGLIVVDFIDMESPEARAELEVAMDGALARDAAHTTFSPISALGLMEISRQRIGVASSQTNTVLCHYCQGDGRVEGDHGFAMRLLREVQQACSIHPEHDIQLQAPWHTANLINNELRRSLHELQARIQGTISVLAHPYEEAPFFHIKTQPRQVDEPASSGQGNIQPPSLDDRQTRHRSEEKAPKPMMKRAELKQADGATPKARQGKRAADKSNWWQKLWGRQEEPVAGNAPKKPRRRPRSNNRNSGSGGGQRGERSRQGASSRGNGPRRDRSPRHRNEGNRSGGGAAKRTTDGNQPTSASPPRR